ncbi:putative ABC transport system permease protein [Methanohalophilus levihalophilus]|uniref:ABC transporter permease n=1 Tax=Methanohalophilus levihalophilus TaxID=1431282 RepID=UPI001AE54F38|nr:ABC transporter permease [Methanohalophilus levihalophilus]MBP2031286.1 putative ABC transport system permease protein [Methanohalophilus levihalophilus]
MRAIDSFRNNMYTQLAERNLKRQKVRTILAAIGIIIGVMAISSMGVLGNTLKLSVEDSFGDIGDRLIIYPTAGEDSVTERQVGDIERVRGIEQIIPFWVTGEAIESRDEIYYGTAYGIESDKLSNLVELEEGRFFKSGSTECVVGNRLASELELKTGSKVEVDGSRLRVVGILKEQGIGIDISADGSIFTSFDMYEKLYPEEGDGYDQVVVVVEDINQVDSVKDDIDETLNRKEKKVEIFATNIINQEIDTAFRSISLFLMGIGSISLLVAGVSILNVMLMSTMERTREIGIMKAVGASKNDVLKMFLYEALFLGILASAAGGILTVGGSMGLIYLITKDISYFFSITTILYISAGVAFGIGTSLIGGLYPAWKASMMKPLDALRYE